MSDHGRQKTISRRLVLAAGAALAAPALLPRRSFAATGPIRIAEPTPGSAGRIWKPLIEKHDNGGLDIEWIGATPGQGQVQVVAGTVDVAFYGAIGASLVNARGGDVVIFGPALNNHGRWIVQSDSPYTSPLDLVGKRIATQAETSETFQQARMAALLHGIDLKKDVELFFGPPAANLALFERRDVDAVIVLEPTATRLVANGARQIARVGDLWREKTGDSSDLVLVGLASKREWLDSNLEQARTLVSLFKTIYGDVRQNPQILRDLYESYGIPRNEENVIDLVPERLAEIYALDWGRPQFDNIDRQLASALELGIIEALPDKPIYAEI